MMRKALLSVLATLLMAFAAYAADTDGDGISENSDNCTEVAQGGADQPGSCDTDNDGYGNACDGDFDQDLDVDTADFNIFKADYESGSDSGAGTDMDCDGDVDTKDYDLFGSQYSDGGPGPSGTAGSNLSVTLDHTLIAGSQVEGTAPLAVYFRGSADLDTVADFREPAYRWDFGDGPCEAGGDTWAHSGKSKCSDVGPIAGHVYDTPGTYTVALSASHEGSSGSDTAEITVTDPATDFPATSTVCISTSGTFDEGCPSDAKRVTSSSDFDALLDTHLTGGKRVLFRRTEGWSCSDTHTYSGTSDAILGAYGSGAKPVVNVSSGTTCLQSGSSALGLRVVDLDFRGTDSASGFVFGASSTDIAHSLLLYRVDASHFPRSYNFQTNSMTPGTADINQEVALVEVTSTSRTSGSGNYDFFGGGERMLLLGNELGTNSDGTEHTLRWHHGEKSLIAHNKLTGPPVERKHVIKMHNHFAGSPCTTEMVIADNLILGGGSNNMVEVWSRDDLSPDDCIRRVRVERNHMKTGVGGFRILRVGAADSLIADNVFDLTLGVDAKRRAMEIKKRDSSHNVAANDIWVRNNSCFMDGTTTNGVVCVEVGSSGENTSVGNNLIWAPDLASDKVDVVDDLGTGTTTATNVEATANPYSVAIPDAASDYQLDVGQSEAPDSGTNSYGDFLGHDYSAAQGSRVVNSTIDVGAWERQ